MRELSVRFLSTSTPLRSPSPTFPALSTTQLPTMALTSEVFSGLCLITLTGVVLLLQRHYLPLRTTPEYLIVATFFPLLISCSIVILVPIDLASSSAGDSGSRGTPLYPLSGFDLVTYVWGAGVVLHQRVLLVAWRVAYWLCFVLTWWEPSW